MANSIPKIRLPKPVTIEVDESTLITQRIGKFLRSEGEARDSGTKFRTLVRQRADLLVKRTLDEAS